GRSGQRSPFSESRKDPRKWSPSPWGEGWGEGEFVSQMHVYGLGRCWQFGDEENHHARFPSHTEVEAIQKLFGIWDLGFSGSYGMLGVEKCPSKSKSVASPTEWTQRLQPKPEQMLW